MGSRKAQDSIKQIKDLLGDVVPEKPEKKKKRVTKKKVSAKRKKSSPKPKLSDKNLSNLVSDALAIEAQEALEADAVGFMCRALTQATMPHKKVEGNEFTRRNGNFRLTMLAPSHVGLPYGNVPRLLMAWIATEAIKSDSKNLILGSSLSDFMGELGMVPTGGRHGSIPRLKEQMKRLFTTSITAVYEEEGHAATKMFPIADSSDIWWTPQSPNQAGMFESVLTLSDAFFREVTENPVPIDMRALKALKRSPMAIDIYTWLTYRMSYLKKPTNIPWQALQLQFGSDYARTRDFKNSFLEQLNKVLVVYPEANVSTTDNGFLLKSSKTHVKKLK